jgi:nucleoside-triphosphatase THEP1
VQENRPGGLAWLMAGHSGANFMKRHAMIIGDIGVGKSSIIERLLALFSDREIYGFYTKKVTSPVDGTNRVYIHPAHTGERHYAQDNCVAVCTLDGGTSHPEVFNTVGAALLRGMPPHSLVVMDELGIFESGAREFCAQVLRILDADYQVLGVVKAKDTDFLKSVKNHPAVALFRLTRENGEEVFQAIKKMFEEIGPDDR